MNGKQCYPQKKKNCQKVLNDGKWGWGDEYHKQGGINMKKAFFNFMGWVSLIVGTVLFIIPGLPGAPILLLSKYFFSV